MKYRVYLSTGASMTVTVEVDDNLDPDKAKEEAIEKAFNAAPSGVCAQCSGWGQPWGLNLGEWEIERDSDGREAEPELVEG